jgi:MFS family permease
VADTVETFRYARGHPVVAALLGSKLGFGLGTGCVGMLALLATGPFDSADGGTGVLLGARGLGVVAGPFVARRLLARWSGRRAGGAGSGHGRVGPPGGLATSGILLACGLAGIVYGAGYLVVGTAPVLAVAVAGALLAHLGGGAQWTLSTYALQSAVPDYIRGRVFAADFAMVTATMSLSLIASGALAELTGARLTTVLLAMVSCLWGVAYLTLTRSLRRATAAEPLASSSASSRN